MLSWLLFRRWRWKFQRERRSAANPLSAAPDRLQRRANPPMSALHCALQGACRPFRRVNHDDDKAALADQATPATTGAHGDRKRVVEGKSVTVSVTPGGSRIITKKKNTTTY